MSKNGAALIEAHAAQECPHCASASHARDCRDDSCRPAAPGAAPREEAHDHCCDGGGEFSWMSRVLIPGALFAAGFLARDWLTANVGSAAWYALMIVAYMLCGLPVLREAVESIRNRDFFNEFTLMGLATLVAIGLGDMAEAVGVMLFYSLGEAVQERAAGHSRRSIEALLASKPETAVVMRNGALEVVPPDRVPIGSTVLVKPGEKVPLDGKVISGWANLDMSSLTGEAIPAAAEKGMQVYSGSICMDGDLVIETTAGQADSMVGKILAMVEHAVETKSRTERFITVFARYYTPAVVAMAALVAVVPPLFAGGEWSQWIYRALVLLVVSCPCALFLSVPLAFFAGIGTASRHGILVKGGQVFDAIAAARAVVFDKTGTLTEGKPALAGIEPAPGVDSGETLRLAAMAESRSNHPLAKAILSAAGGDDAFHDTVIARNLPGMGVAAETSEGEILVGNAKLMADRGIPFPANASANLAVYVARDGKYQGCLLFADRIKADSVAALAELRNHDGVRNLFMLTGDRPEAAAAVAGTVGLDGFRAGLLPDEKVSAFRELSPNGSAVFVGDGVNDAPVLAAAGVGVAMGALGSAAAVEAADAVILDDSPSRLPKLFHIAAKTRRIAGQNIGFALLVKTGVMVLGVMGMTGLWAAVFADVGVALLAVLNSMRVAKV